MLGLICLLFIVLLAMIEDISHYKISNRLIIIGLCIGLILVFFSSEPVGIFFHLIGFFLPVLLLFPLFIIHALGAGDIKLFSLIGLFIGPVMGVRIIYVSFIIGGIYALFIVLRKKLLRVGYRKIIHFTVCIFISLCYCLIMY